MKPKSQLSKMALESRRGEVNYNLGKGTDQEPEKWIACNKTTNWQRKESSEENWDG